ncbi:MAG: hypothetical protein Q8O56_02325 [Solirubrobacteraceae bacterium]|nr:hypothetical protein [Solirubrobacteraceae bacterium]
MSALPPALFEVSFAVPAEMRWAMRAKGVIDDWLLSDAAAQRPVDELPAADLRMEIDHSELRLSWLELEATNAWQAISRASTIVEEIIPELLRTRTLRIDAQLQGPDPEQRRPLGA